MLRTKEDVRIAIQHELFAITRVMHKVKVENRIPGSVCIICDEVVAHHVRSIAAQLRPRLPIGLAIDVVHEVATPDMDKE